MKRTSGILLCCVATLLALGAVMVFSCLSARASTLDIGLEYLFKHALWVAGGVVIMLLMSRLDYHWLERHQRIIGIVALAALAAVLFPHVGTMTHGARRWIRFYGPIGFQPSEIAKLALLVVLCGMAARRGEQMRSLRSGLLPCMAIVGLTAGLILVEPDYGTAALIGIIGSLVVLVAGAPVWPMAAASSAGIAGAAALVWRSPVRQARVLAFLDPAQHLDGAGYQLMHSLIALGSGGLLGRGLGASGQKLFFLPEPETDFIFAVIGEELGLIGALAVIFLFTLILWQGMKIASRARDSFGRLLAFGITALIVFQALIHIAVVTASMPTKGIVLPLVSSGGSSIVVTLAAIGILLNIASQAVEEPAASVAAPQAGDTKRPMEAGV
ncbi:MAG: putative lipid II flippase FtsW [Candidatus Brocadiia bacterium]